jgi:hypothetical protein
MKLNRIVLFFCLAFSVCILTGCSSSDSDNDTDNNNSVTPGNELIGSWVANHIAYDCASIDEFSFTDNGIFTYKTTESCAGGYTETGEVKGSWEVRNDFLYLTPTEISNMDDLEINKDLKLFYFITSTGQLAMCSEDEIYDRVGSGNGFTGTWKQTHDNGCQETLTVNANGTFAALAICPNVDDEWSFSGTYTLNGDRLRISLTEDGREVNIDHFYKIFDSNELMMVEAVSVSSKD